MAESNSEATSSATTSSPSTSPPSSSSDEMSTKKVRLVARRKLQLLLKMFHEMDSVGARWQNNKVAAESDDMSSSLARMDAEMAARGQLAGAQLLLGVARRVIKGRQTSLNSFTLRIHMTDSSVSTAGWVVPFTS